MENASPRIFQLRGLGSPDIRPVALLLTLAGLVGPTPAEAKSPGPVPPGTRETESNRYRSPLTYRATLAWYEKHLGGAQRGGRFETLIDLPDVAAAHWASKSAATPWSGLNVSEFEGNVWIFFIAR